MIVNPSLIQTNMLLLQVSNQLHTGLEILEWVDQTFATLAPMETLTTKVISVGRWEN